jgi:hypothetical protein
VEGLRLCDWVPEFLIGLPAMQGSPIVLEFHPDLRAYRGKLLSGSSEKGHVVHAASFLPERRIVLERQLLIQSRDLRLILTHELFHFVWRRLGNRVRAEFDSLIRSEFRSRARGALGESSGVAREPLTDQDAVIRSQKWKNFVCESFCDTAAWLHAGVAESEHFRLAQRWKRVRGTWFAGLINIQA